MAQATVNARYAFSHSPTPVFNTPELHACYGGADGDSLPFDEMNLLRTVETVLFPGTKIKLLEKVGDTSIWRIESEEYSYSGPLYIDERFVKIADNNSADRRIELPPISSILKTLNSLLGARYIWGGSWPQGVGLLGQLYPSKRALHELTPLVRDTWLLKGVDCSGYLYYATNGWTPRNTSSLVKFGNAVKVEGMGHQEILENLQDLDLLVWAGHVVCVFNQDSTIESKYPDGVIQLGARDRLAEIMKERKPVDDWSSTQGQRFVVRRWHPEASLTS